MKMQKTPQMSAPHITPTISSKAERDRIANIA
jgi:hypothetical protein